MSTFALLDAYSLLRRELSLIFANELKVTGVGQKQMVILYRLTKGTCSMTELSLFSQSDPAATTRTVAALEKSGFVKRASDSTDNRRTLIELTAKGRTKSGKANQVRGVVANLVNGTLSVSEREVLTNLLNKVAKGLQTSKLDEE